MDNKTRYTPYYLAQKATIAQKDQEILDLLIGGGLIVNIEEGLVYDGDGKKLTTRVSKSGYLKCFYDRNDKKKYHLVHRIVLLAFEGMPDNELMECMHLDDDKFNNTITNLKWGTRSENIKKAYATGAKKTVKAGVIPAEIALQIQKFKANGWSYGQLASYFNLNHQTVKNYAHGKTSSRQGRVKPYIVKGPNNQIFRGENLKEFCRMKDLSYSSLYQATRKGKSFKGYELIKDTIDENKN